MTEIDMRAARRHRTTTEVIRRLLKVDHTTLSMEALAAMLVDIVSTSLGIERAALLTRDAERRALRPLAATGFEGGDAPLLRDVPSIPPSGRIDGESVPEPSVRALQQYMQVPCILWAYDDMSGFALVLGNAAADGDDVETLEAALDVFANIIERKRAEQRLLHDAFHDTLSGLPNRPLFIEHLDHAIARATRASGYLFTVLVVDIDRFKVINDSLGHATGDQLLIAFGQRMRNVVRGCDVVARLGSDEFAILADDLSELGDAVRLADRIRSELRKPFELDGSTLFVAASIGIARNGARYVRGTELLRDADIAMNRAKSAGGGHCMFDTDMHAAVVTRQTLETELRQAVDDAQFKLAYQPIIRLADGALAGFEALLRWRHPQRGDVLPGEFIRVAEETGLIVPIGRWVLEEVCRRLAGLNRRRAAPLSVSINLSDREFLQPWLIEEIGRVLEETGVPPRCLHFELTERMLLTDARMDSGILARLKALGVGLVIDDFGTGHSSLARLQALPIDSLKVDCAFVRGLGVDDGGTAIVRTIIALAHELGVEVVAEGVEHAEQLALLRDLGCQYAQGYLFSRPLEDRRVAPAAARGDWLAAG